MLPRALCRRLQTPQALSALLRVRCCPELRIARAYGRLVSDTDHEHLYHCVACDPYDAVAFDLALTTRQGFKPQVNGKATHPVIQVRLLNGGRVLGKIFVMMLLCHSSEYGCFLYNA